MTSPDIDLDDRLKDLLWQFRNQLHRSVELDARDQTCRVVASLLLAAETLTEPFPDDLNMTTALRANCGQNSRSAFTQARS
jgi:hypothetical protein